MAELLIKIGDGAGFSDGDVLCAFNRRRIRCVHAMHLCQLHPVNNRALRPSELAKDLREAIHQYRFERVSKTTVKRTEIATGIEQLFGPDEIDVRLFLQRRLRHPKHAIFGKPGGEVWYGGKVDFGDSALDQVWLKIAEKTDRLESEQEFQLWPMGRLDIRHHLAVRTVDFTDDESEGLMSPQFELDQDGEFVLDQDGHRRLIAKRNIRVDWRSELLDDLEATESQVLDKRVAVGRNVVIAANKFRYESKSQPNQGDRGKLHNKATGGRLSNG